MAAHQAYASGAEVHASFGPNLSPPELLLDYGTVGQVVGPSALDDTTGRQNKFEADASVVGEPQRVSVR